MGVGILTQKPRVPQGMELYVVAQLGSDRTSWVPHQQVFQYLVDRSVDQIRW